MTVSSAPKLRLLSTQDKEIATKCRTLNSVEWGKGLKLEEYLKREELLASCEFAKTLSTWVLLDENDDIVTCCETYTRDCLYQSRLMKCVSIASVFTPSNHRRKGYAAAMLSQLQSELKKMDNVVASTLYSDIGPDYYHKMNWKCYPSITLSTTVHQSTNDQQTVSFLSLEQAKVLIRNEASELIANANTSGKDTLTLLPSPENLEWHLQRAKFYLSLNDKDNNSLESKLGLQKDTDYLVWTIDTKKKSLSILHAKLSAKTSTLDLLLAAKKQALEWKLATVDMWGPLPNVSQWTQECGWSVVERSESLSSLCMFDAPEPEWLLNEKLFWV